MVFIYCWPAYRHFLTKDKPRKYKIAFIIPVVIVSLFTLGFIIPLANLTGGFSNYLSGPLWLLLMVLLVLFGDLFVIGYILMENNSDVVSIFLSQDQLSTLSRINSILQRLWIPTFIVTVSLFLMYSIGFTLGTSLEYPLLKNGQVVLREYTDETIYGVLDSTKTVTSIMIVRDGKVDTIDVNKKVTINFKRFN